MLFAGGFEALFEAVDTSAAVYQLLLAGEERVAVGADFNVYVFFCGAGFDGVTAGTGDGGFFVFWMDVFHWFVPLLSSYACDVYHRLFIIHHKRRFVKREFLSK